MSSGAHGIDLVGRDFGASVAGMPAYHRVAVAAFAGLLAAALGLSTLRTQIIDLRYRLAEAVHEERLLLERQRQLTVEVQRLRDPMRLRALARERGFIRPERVIHLDRRGAPLAGDGL